MVLSSSEDILSITSNLWKINKVFYLVEIIDSFEISNISNINKYIYEMKNSQGHIVFKSHLSKTVAPVIMQEITNHNENNLLYVFITNSGENTIPVPQIKKTNYVDNSKVFDLDIKNAINIDNLIEELIQKACSLGLVGKNELDMTMKAIQEIKKIENSFA